MKPAVDAWNIKLSLARDGCRKHLTVLLYYLDFSHKYICLEGSVDSACCHYLNGKKTF